MGCGDLRAHEGTDAVVGRLLPGAVVDLDLEQPRVVPADPLVAGEEGEVEVGVAFVAAALNLNSAAEPEKDCDQPDWIDGYKDRDEGDGEFLQRVVHRFPRLIKRETLSRHDSNICARSRSPFACLPVSLLLLTRRRKLPLTQLPPMN